MVGAANTPTHRRLVVNGRQLAQIALGSLGVWALLEAVAIIASFFETVAASGGVSGAALIVGVPTLILLGLSYVLVFHNAQLARALAPDDAAAVGLGTPDIARLLVALLGAMTVLQVLPRCVNLVLNIFAAAGDPDAVHGGGLYRALIGTGIELACALYLVMRPERFLAFLNRPRPDAVEMEATA